ncbi:DedA family protein [Zymobacter sp. IVIA_5232.4 C2]|uniref:DedA family protein n=1 Tax=Zymobacter sp. IVIA_5232.4 C2 TaxID=3394855 RepID=UPI0039C4B15B
MSDSVNLWLQHYGYLAVLLGCLLEGETVVILAGIAVHKGLFSLPMLMGVVWFGGMLGDVVLYLMGHFFGQRLLDKLSWRKGRVRKVQGMIRRHQHSVIFGVRFLYGLRIVGPIVIGTSGVPIRTFLFFNLLGAAVWAVLFTLLGYLIGPAVLKAYAQVEQYQGWVWGGITLLVVAWWGGHYWWSHRHRHEQ